MAAQAVAIPEITTIPEGGSDIFLIAMPLVTYRFISDEAMKRGMTFAQAMQQALNQWAGTQPILK